MSRPAELPPQLAYLDAHTFVSGSSRILPDDKTPSSNVMSYICNAAKLYMSLDVHFTRT